METLRPGQVFGGCKIERFLARGGMGAVYKAHKPLIDLDVAVKVLHSDLVADATLLKRFLREARLAARFDHPAIVKVYDVGEENGLYFICMEYVEGRDLRQILKEDGPLSAEKALDVARQVAEGLDYAHERGIVHRDIKPGNIIVATSGAVKIADLGLARPMNEESEVTLGGEIVGTPVYMSPEHCRGDVVDGRTDLYSLGATLYHVLTSRRPFHGDSPGTVVCKVLNERPPPIEELLPDLPSNVASLVQRLLAKHPIGRPQTGRQLVDEIDAITRGEDPSARPVRSDSAPNKPPVPWAQIAGLAAAIAVLGVGVFLALPFLATSQTLATSGENGLNPSWTRPVAPLTTTAHETTTEPPGRDEDEDVSPASDPELAERAEVFRLALGTANLDALLDCLAPAAISNPALVKDMSRVLAEIQEKDLLPRAFSVANETSERAVVGFELKPRRGGRSGILPVTWERVNDGWYANPYARPASRD